MPNVKCIECGREYPLSMDGTLRRHKADDIDGNIAYCSGSCKKPMAVCSYCHEMIILFKNGNFRKHRNGDKKSCLGSNKKAGGVCSKCGQIVELYKNKLLKFHQQRGVKKLCSGSGEKPKS